MQACPSCGGSHVVAVAEHYAAQVRIPESDPEALAALAPPLRRSIFHGTASITLFFLAFLSPGFVPPQRAYPVLATFLALGAVTFLTWIRARRTDRAAMAAYQGRRMCEDCRWEG
ncbi:hypothetical protein [Mesoterricola silvestris]|uniref:Uncharacterized protein n=1 Tax=Mesoterricola silvestris TaxID=2927979 RepID=A0AA48GVP2_9BACT|nr:hypothetical protein [Mesoterricola silvestris]BDU71188.1 hypothetical protein METEAL_03620 [Mesoterricola silvestris]